MSNRVILVMLTWVVAVAHVAEAQELDADGIKRRWNAAHAAFANDDYDRATEVTRSLVTLLPFDPSLQVFLARCAAKMENHERTITHLRKAADLGWEGDRQVCELQEFKEFHAEAEFLQILGRITLNRHRPYVVYQGKAVDAETTCPLIVLFHGRGELPDIQLHFWKQAADENGLVVLALKGTRRIGSVYSWEQEEATETWEVDRAAVAEKVATGIGEVRKHHKVGKIIFAGFSQGSVAAVSALQKPLGEDVSGAILFSAAFPSEVDALNPLLGIPQRLRIAVFAGEKDPWFEGSRRFAEQRESSGGLIRFQTWPDLAHQMPQAHSRVIRDALRWIEGEIE